MTASVIWTFWHLFLLIYFQVHRVAILRKYWVNLTHLVSLALVPKNTLIAESNYDSLTQKWVIETLILTRHESLNDPLLGFGFDLEVDLTSQWGYYLGQELDPSIESNWPSFFSVRVHCEFLHTCMFWLWIYYYIILYTTIHNYTITCTWQTQLCE